MTGKLELDPLISLSLSRRFPHLRTAMDSERMRHELERGLFNGGGAHVVSCARPRAELNDGTCWLQYPLLVQRSTNDPHELLVLATMFAEPGVAAGFEQESLAPLAERCDRDTDLAPRSTCTVQSLELAASVFPINNRLPTLVDATDPLRLRAALRPLLNHGGEVELAGIDLVHLRRTRGCVLRFRLHSSSPATVYGKVGYDAQPAAISDGLAAFAESGTPICTPRVLGHSTELDLTVVSEVPGTRPDLRTQPGLDETVHAAALIAASLHGSGIAAGGIRTLEDEITRARHSVEPLGEHAPVLASQLNTILDTLSVRASTTDRQEPALAHGDLTPSQLLFDDESIGIVDFDKLCQAEPALDLGRFLAYLRFAMKKHGNTAADDMASWFITVYSALGGRRTPAARVDLYEIASLVRMAAQSWLQLKPSRLAVVLSVLEDRVPLL